MANYFIKIEDGPDARRKLLESSKASLHVLKGYQELLKVRGEKLTHMGVLRQQLKELTILMNRAEALLPQLTERELEELRPKPVEQVKVVPKQQIEVKGKTVNGKKVYTAPPKVKLTVNVPVQTPELPPVVEEKPRERLTELEKLEAALKGIESKLGDL